MENKAKFILIGLAGLFLISVFFGLKTFQEKQALLQESENLKKEKSSLQESLSGLDKKLRTSIDRINALNGELEKAYSEKQDLDRKLDSVTKEREELAAKLRSRAARQEAPIEPSQSFQAPALPESAESYWADILKAKTDLEMQLGSLRTEIKTLQISNEELQRDKSTVQREVKKLDAEKQDLQRQFDYNKKIMDSIAQELVRERNDKIQIQDSYKTIKNENAQLLRQLNSLNVKKTDLEKKVFGLQEKNADIDKKFSEIEVMLTDKVSQVEDLKKQLDSSRGDAAAMQAEKQDNEPVELPPIVVRPKQEDLPPNPSEVASSGLSGKVLAINKENNFVIVDLGEASGIKVGESFSVYRQDKSIAAVEVIKVSKTVSACDIKKAKSPIKVGDIIK